MNVAHQQVVRQTRLYHDKVAPGIKPIAVEEHAAGLRSKTGSSYPAMST